MTTSRRMNINKITIILCLASLLTGCMDMNDTTPPVNATIQLVKPEVFTQMTDLSGITVTLTSSIDAVQATTDSEGKILLTELAPNTYDISLSCDLTHEQYEQFSGQKVGGNMDFLMTATLNQQVITKDGTIQLPMTVAPKETLIIGKVYPSWKKVTGSTFKNGRYVELYNNSDTEVDAAGIYLGLLESESTLPFKVYPYEEAETPGILHMKQIFRIPTDKSVMVAPGGTLLIVNSAFDHSTQNEWERDLTGADYEAKDLSTTSPIPNNDNVAALQLIYTTYNDVKSPITYMNLIQGGPVSLVIFRTDEDVTQWKTVYATGKTSGRLFMEVPVDCVLDGVEILKHSTSFEAGANINTKRLFQEVDAGFTFANSASGNAGERLVRKTAMVTSDGRKILQDTNNSSNDFICTDTISPRNYLEP